MQTKLSPTATSQKIRHLKCQLLPVPSLRVILIPMNQRDVKMRKDPTVRQRHSDVFVRKDFPFVSSLIVYRISPSATIVTLPANATKLQMLLVSSLGKSMTMNESLEGTTLGDS